MSSGCAPPMRWCCVSDLVVWHAGDPERIFRPGLGSTGSAFHLHTGGKIEAGLHRIKKLDVVPTDARLWRLIKLRMLRDPVRGVIHTGGIRGLCTRHVKTRFPRSTASSSRPLWRPAAFLPRSSARSAGFDFRVIASEAKQSCAACHCRRDCRASRGRLAMTRYRMPISRRYRRRQDGSRRVGRGGGGVAAVVSTAWAVLSELASP